MINLLYYVIEIRKLAAEYQLAGNLSEAKSKVDVIIRSFSEELGEDKTGQVKIWTDLLEELDNYYNTTAHPKWKIVISHAKMRIKNRKRSVLNK